MNSEVFNQDNAQPNEAYAAWANLATSDDVNEVNKSHADDESYNDENWLPFESRAQDATEQAKFREGMAALDARTRSYLRELPGNIDEVFGVNDKSYKLIEVVEESIVKNMVDAWYDNLYLANDGELFNSDSAVEQREIDQSDEAQPDEASFDEVWRSWTKHIPDGQDRQNFITNMQQLDERTQKYLRNLPNNMFCTLGMTRQATDFALNTRAEIITRTINGDYLGTGPDGQNWNLYLTDNGKLYGGLNAGRAREEDETSVSLGSQAPEQPAPSRPESKPAVMTPEDFGFRDW